MPKKTPHRVRERFMAMVAMGVSAEDAAHVVGISPATAYRIKAASRTQPGFLERLAQDDEVLDLLERLMNRLRELSGE
jgi:hypothetical protein